MKFTRKRGVSAGASVLVAALVTALSWVGSVPAQASSSSSTTVITSGSCTAEQSYEESIYKKPVTQQVWRFKTRVHRPDQTYEEKFINSTRFFVDGGTTTLRNKAGQNVTVSGHWTSGTKSWHKIADSVINAYWGSGGIDSNLIGGSQGNPKGTVPTSVYGDPNSENAPYYATVNTLTGEYTEYGPWSDWSTTNPGSSTDLMEVETSQQVVPGQYVWYGPGGTPVGSAAQAQWLDHNPGGDWMLDDTRQGSHTVTVPCAPSGTVTFTDTVCDGTTPVDNIGTVTLEDNSTAEGFLWDGTQYVSIGDVPEGNFGDALVDDYGFPAKVRIVITGEDGTSLPPFDHEYPTASKVASDCTVVVPPAPTASMTASCGVIHIEASNPLPAAPNTTTTSVDLDVEIDGVTSSLTLAPGETYSNDVSFAEDSGDHSGEVRDGSTILASVDDVSTDCQPNHVTGNPAASAQEQCTAVLGTKVGGADATYTFSFPAVVLGPNDVIDPVTFLYIDGNDAVQQVVMNAGDPDVVKTVHYTEDANGGSKTVQYGIKGQPLKELTVDTNCTTPPEQLAMTGSSVGLAVAFVIACICGGIFLMRRSRKQQTDMV